MRDRNMDLFYILSYSNHFNPYLFPSLHYIRFYLNNFDDAIFEVIRGLLPKIPILQSVSFVIVNEIEKKKTEYDEKKTEKRQIRQWQIEWQEKNSKWRVEWQKQIGEYHYTLNCSM